MSSPCFNSCLHWVSHLINSQKKCHIIILMMLAEKRKTMPHFSFAIREYLLEGERTCEQERKFGSSWQRGRIQSHTLAVAHWKSAKNGRKDNCVQHCVCAMALRMLCSDRGSGRKVGVGTQRVASYIYCNI